MSDALPATTTISVYRITPVYTPFLTKQQVVQVDLQDLLVTLVSGAMHSPASLLHVNLLQRRFARS